MPLKNEDYELLNNFGEQLGRGGHNKIPQSTSGYGYVNTGEYHRSDTFDKINEQFSEKKHFLITHAQFCATLNFETFPQFYGNGR